MCGGVCLIYTKEKNYKHWCESVRVFFVFFFFFFFLFFGGGGGGRVGGGGGGGGGGLGLKLVRVRITFRGSGLR